ncbi:MAG: hypothetical protein WDN00_05560 [Limisphaerales bacterium]
MKIKPAMLGGLAGVLVCIGGLITSEAILNTEHKPLLSLLWPPTVRWIAWFVIGIIVGGLIRNCVQRRQ